MSPARDTTAAVISERAPEAARRDYRRFDQVAVIAGDHRAIAYFVRGDRGTERTLATCPIVRGAP